jgi:hypothetical protein
MVKLAKAPGLIVKVALVPVAPPPLVEIVSEPAFVIFTDTWQTPFANVPVVPGLMVPEVSVKVFVPV